MKNIYIQQGDVLLFLENLPNDLEELKTNIVMTGESTHKHKLNGDSFKIFEEPKTKVKYLRLVKSTELTHEEHGMIVIPPGEYRVGQVREKGMFDDLIAPVVD